MYETYHLFWILCKVIGLDYWNCFLSSFDEPWILSFLFLFYLEYHRKCIHFNDHLRQDCNITWHSYMIFQQACSISKIDTIFSFAVCKQNAQVFSVGISFSISHVCRNQDFSLILRCCKDLGLNLERKLRTLWLDDCKSLSKVKSACGNFCHSIEYQKLL